MLLNMEKKCCLKHCSTNSEEDSTPVSFFKFPKSSIIRIAWEKAIHIKGFKSDDETLLCSRHFSEENIRVIRGRSVLKKSAVPELNLKPEPPLPNRTKKLAKEVKTAERKGSAKCLVCQQPVGFMYEFLTDAHAHRAYAMKKLICGHCLHEFESFSDLMSHVTSIGSAKEYVPDRSELAPLPHVAPRRQYPCSQCSSVFSTTTARLYHEVTHSAANQVDFCKQMKLKVQHANNREGSVLKTPIKPGRRIKILAADPSEIYFDEPQDERNEMPLKKQRDPPVKKQCRSSQKKLCESPTKNQLMPPAKKLCKANSLSGRKHLNTISSLPPHQKQQLVSAVYCNQCEQQFSTLKLLDQHYWSQHSNMDIPLDLAFEVGSVDVLPRVTVCSVCTKRTACVNTIETLLHETAKDIETVHSSCLLIVE